jgi:hypothetical protein
MKMKLEKKVISKKVIFSNCHPTKKKKTKVNQNEY